MKHSPKCCNYDRYRHRRTISIYTHDFLLSFVWRFAHYSIRSKCNCILYNGSKKNLPNFSIIKRGKFIFIQRVLSEFLRARNNEKFTFRWYTHRFMNFPSLYETLMIWVVWDPQSIGLPFAVSKTTVILASF